MLGVGWVTLPYITKYIDIMTKELRVALDDSKTLVGVRTEGNVAILLYEECIEIRPIGFVHSYQIDDEDEEESTNTKR